LVLADTLEELGFEVVQAASAREGMASAERLLAFQVAFIDVGLPDRSGIELARELRSRWPYLRIAIASGYGAQAIGIFANDPCATTLSKPFDSATVAAALKNLGIDIRADRCGLHR
jgi:ActR/RegA family two-component response regulator